MPSITRPPTLAEVQADYYDREQRMNPSEREVRRRDLEHAAVVERQQALAERAPAVSTAWQLTQTLNLPAIPLDSRSLKPVAEAITGPLATLEHWQAHPTHAVGIRLGAHRGGEVGLVGVRADTWAGVATRARH